jgi:hypothetical protein
MDGIGDYIYIIILVLAGLSGLLKSKKKKTTETEMPFPEQSEFEEFENYSEDEFRYENLESEVSRWESDKTLEKATLSYENTDDVSSLRIKKEIKAQVYENFKGVDIFVVEQDEDNFELELDSANDFKKALIYSEIINRKY